MSLSGRMAESARRRGYPRVAERFEERVADGRAHAAALLGLLQRAGLIVDATASSIEAETPPANGPAPETGRE
jgi:rubrerythrin